MTDRIDLELSIRDVDPDDAPGLWKRLNLVAEGFLRDGRDVQVTTYRFTDNDDVEAHVGPPETGAQK